ncbi:MAG: hypothetical protein C0597_17240, partial [Marinilabiliales bacterium]
MTRKFLFVLIIIILNIPLIAQMNKNGIPLMKNYAPNDYGASEQNWAICEDNRGVIYVGNTEDGILEFDGSTWKKIPISNGSIVRSLAHLDGTVYVGGVEEFGYLAPDKQGRIHYNSLVNQLDTIDFKDVWKIYILDRHVYFCCDEVIYSFEDKKLKNVYRNTDGSFLSFKVHDEIYWGHVYDGPYKLINDSVEFILGGEFYKEKDIFLMLPWSENEIFIATIGEGIFIYNKTTGLSKTLRSLGPQYKDLANILDDSQIYNGTQLSNGDYALATLNNGCLVFNSAGDIVYKLDKENGLQDFVVINLYETLDGNLWMALNKGISYAEISTPFTRLGNEYGLEGIILDVKRYNDVLFVATNIGAYFLDYNENNLPIFKSIPIDNRLVWQIEEFKVPNSDESKLLFATDYHVREYFHNKEPELVSSIEYNCRIIY